MENIAASILLDHYPEIGEDLSDIQIEHILAAMYSYGNSMARKFINELIESNPETRPSKQAIEWLHSRINKMD